MSGSRPLERCRRGHLRTEANIYTRPDGKRDCRECDRERYRKASGWPEDYGSKARHCYRCHIPSIGKNGHCLRADCGSVVSYRGKWPRAQPWEPSVLQGGTPLGPDDFPVAE